MRAKLLCHEIEHPGDLEGAIENFIDAGALRVEVLGADFERDESALFLVEFQGSLTEFKNSAEEAGIIW